MNNREALEIVRMLFKNANQNIKNNTEEARQRETEAWAETCRHMDDTLSKPVKKYQWLFRESPHNIWNITQERLTEKEFFNSQVAGVEYRKVEDK